jgi:deoxyribonuclease-4
MVDRMLIGSHVSTAGGLHTGIETADKLGFNALALFVGIPRQWKLPALSDDRIKAFRARRAKSGVEVIVAHASYLLNLAGENVVRDKAIKALGDELQRCVDLGIECLVLHPGSCPDLELGIERIIDGLNEVMAPLARKKITLLVEGMAGQGNTIGHRFEHLARILKGVKHRRRYGVCLDTCHLYAAGYDISTPKGWKDTMLEFDRIVGIQHLRALHCNDSQRELGSRVDRHAHIGQGELGKQAFKHVMQDKRLAGVPVILETPKGEREKDGKDWDVINSQILKRFAKAGAKKQA